MSRLNEFLNTAAHNKKLSIVHYRSDGIVPHTEHMSKKLFAVIKKVSPETAIEESAVGPANPGPSQHAMAVEKVVAANPATSRYLSRTKMPDTRGAPRTQSAQIELIGQLHDASLADFGRMSATALPLNVIASASSTLFETLPKDKLDDIDTLFQHSFADAKAVMLISSVDGSDSAKKAVEDIVTARMKNGDINPAVGLSNSHDTSGALMLVRAEIAGGAEYERLSQDKLNAHARSVAAQGVGIWLSNQGVPMRAANGFADFMEEVSDVSHRAAVTVGNTSTDANKAAPSRPRMH